MNRAGGRRPAKAATLAAEPPRVILICDLVSVACLTSSSVHTTMSWTTSPMPPSMSVAPGGCFQSDRDLRGDPSIVAVEGDVGVEAGVAGGLADELQQERGDLLP